MSTSALSVDSALYEGDGAALAPSHAEKTIASGEVPLEISDFSCATAFEEVVRDVEKFLSEAFQSQRELASFLFSPAPADSSSSSSSTTSPVTSPHSSPVFSMASTSPTDDHRKTPATLSGGVASGSQASIGGPMQFPFVLGRNFSLGGRRGTGADPAVCVEIHAMDLAHDVCRQFSVPLFLLIRSTAQQTPCRDSEAAYYLSLLTTAVGNVFGPQLALDVDASTHAIAVHRAAKAQESRGTDMYDAKVLPSPHRFHPNCIPCFTPVGDPFRGSFLGYSPPLALARAPSNADDDVDSPTTASPLRWQPSFSTHFKTSAFGQAPATCRHLADILDMFQLQVGQRSRIVSGELGGICASVSKRYRLSIPWRFRLGGPAAAQAGVSTSPSSACTWNECLARENEALLVLSGPHTHPIGTNIAPLAAVHFSFQWRQLGELEAQETKQRSYINPFALSATAIGKEVNRKCAVTARAVVQPEAELRHAATGSIRDVVNLLLEHMQEKIERGSAPRPDASDEEASLRSDDDEILLEERAQSILKRGLQNATAQEALIEKLAEQCSTASRRDASDPATLRQRLTQLFSSQTGNVRRGEAPVGLPAAELGKSQQPHTRDLRRIYFPGSLLSRFAYYCAEEDARNRLDPADVHRLWVACVAALRRHVESGTGNGVAAAVEYLGLPVATDPPVDLTLPLAVQKLQMLAHSLRQLQLRGQPVTPQQEPAPREGGDGKDSVSAEATAAATAGQAASSEGDLRLITNGEPIIVPAPLPHPLATSDTVLYRAQQMNDLTASDILHIPTEWLCGETLYNDMCLFRYVNEAHRGRIVRFPDFIHWHSPRDFRRPPDGVVSDDDNDYLSSRMRSDEHGSPGHVWAGLWRRSVPRPREQIIASSFRPADEAAAALRWLETELTENVIFLEVANACVANAVHRLLCHRFVTPAAARPARTQDGGRSSVIPEVKRYVMQRYTALTTRLESASALLVATPWAAATLNDFEGIATTYATALREVDEIETCISAALAVECVMGKDNARLPEGAALIQGVSAPCADQADPTRLMLAPHPISLATWAALVADRFVEESDRAPVHMRARLTCMAERPLDTAECLQQLVVERQESGAFYLNLVLSQEVC